MSMAPEANAPEDKKKRSGRSERVAREQSEKPVGKQRRPAMMALALMLIAVSALGGVWLANRGNETREVIMVAQHVPYGDTIEASDLEMRAFPIDVTGIDTVAWEDLDSVAGTVAQRDLAANSLLLPDAYGDEIELEDGRVVLGVTVTPDRMPAFTLKPGSTVTLVETPAQGNDLQTGANFEAIFISQDGIDVSGEVRLTLDVNAADAASIAARAATDRIYVIVGKAS